MTRRTLLAALAWLGVGVAVAGESPPETVRDGEVRLVSEEWVDFSAADGTGVAWDVLRRIFEPEGMKVITRTVPYSRSVGLVMRGEADAWVGSYAGEVADAYYPQWWFDRDKVSALSLQGTAPPTLDTLKDHRLVWMRGYAYERYLPGIKGFEEIQRRASVLPMLDARRVDYFVDARVDIDAMLAETDNASRYQVTDLTYLPLYLGFANTPRGRVLAALYDRRMGELIASGELRAIFARWDWEYPFEG